MQRIYFSRIMFLCTVVMALLLYWPAAAAEADGDKQGVRRVARSAIVHVEPDTLWALIGQWHGRTAWHPEVKQDVSLGSQVRHDVRHDGERGPRETLKFRDDVSRSLTYWIIGPAVNPLEGGSLSVYRHSHGESLMIWDGFYAHGASTQAPETTTRGLELARYYEAGLSALVARFKGKMFPFPYPAAALTVQRHVDLKANPDAVWSLIGGRFAFPQWHPLIKRSLSVDHDRHRRDVGAAPHPEGAPLERFLYHDDISRIDVYDKVADPAIDELWTEIVDRYGYNLTSYEGRIEAQPTTDGGTRVTWTVHMTPNAVDQGKPVEQISAPLIRFYEVGLQNLAKMFGS
jgi:hypothetical protein